MSRFGRITLAYFLVGTFLSCLVSYWDYHRISSGSDFHQLNGVQRNSIRATGVIMVLMNPGSIVTTSAFIKGKPRDHKNAKLVLVLVLSLLPSYLIWIVLFRKKKVRWRLLKE